MTIESLIWVTAALGIVALLSGGLLDYSSLTQQAHIRRLGSELLASVLDRTIGSSGASDSDHDGDGLTPSGGGPDAAPKGGDIGESRAASPEDTRKISPAIGQSIVPGYEQGAADLAGRPVRGAPLLATGVILLTLACALAAFDVFVSPASSAGEAVPTQQPPLTPLPQGAPIAEAVPVDVFLSVAGVREVRSNPGCEGVALDPSVKEYAVAVGGTFIDTIVRFPRLEGTCGPITLDLESGRFGTIFPRIAGQPTP